MAELKYYVLPFSHGSVSLNSEQYAVVTSPLGENQRILASAGSGKTTTITARIAYLLEHYEIRPQSILLATFSRSAAHEMRERVFRLSGPKPIYCGTFHALSMCRYFAHRLQRWTSSCNDFVRAVRVPIGFY